MFLSKNNKKFPKVENGGCAGEFNLRRKKSLQSREKLCIIKG